MATQKKRRNVSIPPDVIKKLVDDGEIEVDSIGRVRGFHMFIRRMVNSRGNKR